MTEADRGGVGETRAAEGGETVPLVDKHVWGGRRSDPELDAEKADAEEADAEEPDGE